MVGVVTAARIEARVHCGSVIVYSCALLYAQHSQVQVQHLTNTPKRLPQLQHQLSQQQLEHQYNSHQRHYRLVCLECISAIPHRY